MAPVAARLIKAPSVVLPNLVLGESVYPEFIQEACTPGNIWPTPGAAALPTPRERASAAHRAGQSACALQVAGHTPSEAAAEIVLDYAENGRSAGPLG